MPTSEVVSPEPALRRAADALEDADAVRALDALLDAWRAYKAAEIAELIEALGRKIDSARSPIETKNRRALDEAWTDLARERRASDVGRLLGVLEAASAPMLKGWLLQLAELRPDPRIPRPALIAAHRFTSTGAGPTRTAALRLARAIGDGRLLVKPIRGVDLDAIAPAPPLPPPIAPLVDGLRDAITKVSLPKEARSTPRPSRNDEEADLVAAVLADPADDSARLVFGDWLLERGELRGELVTLQAKGPAATPADEKRIAALIAAHGDTWIRPLDRAVTAPRFRLGFFSGCDEVKFRSKKDRQELGAHSLWSTVEAIDRTRETELLASGALCSLRRLGASVACLAHLAKSNPPPKLSELVLFIDVGDLEDTISYEPLLSGDGPWNTVAEVGSLGNVRALTIVANVGFGRSEGGRPADFEWLTSTKLAKQLDALTVVLPHVVSHLGEWLDAFTKGSLSGLARLELQHGGLIYQKGMSLKLSGTRRCRFRWILQRSPDSPRLTLEVGSDDADLASDLGESIKGAHVDDVSLTWVGAPISKNARQKALAATSAVLSKHVTSIHL